MAPAIVVPTQPQRREYVHSNVLCKFTKLLLQAFSAIFRSTSWGCTTCSSGRFSPTQYSCDAGRAGRGGAAAAGCRKLQKIMQSVLMDFCSFLQHVLLEPSVGAAALLRRAETIREERPRTRPRLLARSAAHARTIPLLTSAQFAVRLDRPTLHLRRHYVAAYESEAPRQRSWAPTAGNPLPKNHQNHPPTCPPVRLPRPSMRPTRPTRRDTHECQNMCVCAFGRPGPRTEIASSRDPTSVAYRVRL